MNEHRNAQNSGRDGNDLTKALRDLTESPKPAPQLELANHWLEQARETAYSFSGGIKETAQKAPIGTAIGALALGVAAYGAIRTALPARLMTRIAEGELVAESGVLAERGLLAEGSLINGGGRSVVHLTSAEGGVGIANTLKVGGRWGIFALEENKVPQNALMRNVKSLVVKDLVHEVPIGPNASSYFRPPTPVGPFSLARNIGGVRSTPLGSIDLARDTFLRNEIFANGTFRQATTSEIRQFKAHQYLLDYGVDSLAYTFTGIMTAAYEYGHQKPSDNKANQGPRWHSNTSFSKINRPEQK